MCSHLFFFFSPLKKVSESSDLFDRNIILRIGSSLTNHRNTFKKPCLFPTRRWAVIANTVVLCTYLIVWINHVNMTIYYEFTYVLFYMLYLRFLYCRSLAGWNLLRSDTAIIWVFLNDALWTWLNKREFTSAVFMSAQTLYYYTAITRWFIIFI